MGRIAFHFAPIFLRILIQELELSNLRRAEIPGSHDHLELGEHIKNTMKKTTAFTLGFKSCSRRVMARWSYIILCFFLCLCRDARRDEPQWCKANPSNRRWEHRGHNRSRIYSSNWVNDISSDVCSDVTPWALVIELFCPDIYICFTEVWFLPSSSDWNKRSFF